MASLEVKRVSKTFRLRGGQKLLALDDVSFEIVSGSTIALVGQSGSGKSTLAKVIMQLETPTRGEILLDGRALPRRGRAHRRYLHQVRMIFQDPFASLNPYHSIRHHVERPLELSGVTSSSERRRRAAALLEQVRLIPSERFLDRRPHELSGGQRQRVAIARALATSPDILIADEPVSMLDVSIRLDVLTLLASLQEEYQIGMLYITHDLATARYFSEKIMVMHNGRIVERGDSDEVILHPKDEYTRKLRDASPNPDSYFSNPRHGASSSLDGGDVS